MPILKVKPTSPGRRAVVKVISSYLYKGSPYKPLLYKQNVNSGRNNIGRITVRHKGCNHKQHYRVIDFKRNKDNINGIIERIEYDPNRTSNIALVLYIDGERRYILAPKGITVGQYIISGNKVPINIGNSMPIKNIPIGTIIHCIEIKPGKGGQLMRSAGSSAVLLSRENMYSKIRLRSGEIRLIHIKCRATIGSIGNEEYNLRKFGKAGSKRHLGIRPTVRGVAMNPIDHPHGGGEGRTSAGRNPVSPWGKQTKGFRTRRNKRTSNMIVQRR